MDCFLEISFLAVFMTSTADIFDCTAKVVVQVLISDEIPNFYFSSGVVGG